jgi:hypothetical protein
MAAKFPKAVKTPALHVAIYCDGKHVRNVKFDDPRQSFVRLTNRVGHGLHAVPIAKAVRKAVAK